MRFSTRIVQHQARHPAYASLVVFVFYIPGWELGLSVEISGSACEEFWRQRGRKREGKIVDKCGRRGGGGSKGEKEGDVMQEQT